MNRDLIKEHYNKEVIGIVKLSKKTFKIFTNDETFLLKEHDDEYIEDIFVRLSLLNLDTFLIPYRTIDGSYLFYHEDRRYALYHFYDDEPGLNKDIRLHLYIKSLAELHQLSSFPMNVSDGYFVDKLDYLQREIDEVSSLILNRVRRIEREEYHNPADWYFYMNYQHFHLALNQAKKYLDALDTSYKEAKELHLSLTYQNFDYSHILVKAQKILSLDKMAIASPVYDIVFLFDDDISYTIDATVFLKEYFGIHSLEQYEIYELLTFLFIPKLSSKTDIKEDIGEISRALRYLRRVEKVASFIASSSTV